jgi:hypothetical protein
VLIASPCLLTGTLNLLPEKQGGQPVFVWLYITNGWEILRNIRFCINIFMQITGNIIRQFLDQQAKHISHYVVSQSYYRPYHKLPNEMDRMVINLKKDLRHARNCLNRELYGNGARRKPLIYQPLLIPTLEGTKNTTNPQLTLHYNIYLGNLPTILTTEDIKELWTYCWHTKANQSNDIYITEPLANTQSHLLQYGTKETQTGNLSCWDFENTQIPYNALNTD